MKNNGLKGEECIMVGNNILEDMSAAALGFDVFLVTGFEVGTHEPGLYPGGDLSALLAWVRALPKRGGNGMICIFGLGNPGMKYKKTRHNAGFRVIDLLAKEYGIRLRGSKFQAKVGEGFVHGKKILLVKPQTYMNDSGWAVSAALDYFKVAAAGHGCAGRRYGSAAGQPPYTRIAEARADITALNPS